jgi:hypothetical protein
VGVQGGVPGGGGQGGGGGASVCDVQSIGLLQDLGATSLDFGVVARGNDFGLLTTTVGANGSAVAIQTVDDTGLPSPTVPIAGDLVNALSPAITATRFGFIAAWSDDSAEDFNVRAQVLDAQGLPVGAIQTFTQSAFDDVDPTLLPGVVEDQNILAFNTLNDTFGQAQQLVIDDLGRVVSPVTPIATVNDVGGLLDLAALDTTVGPVLAFVDGAGALALQPLSGVTADPGVTFLNDAAFNGTFDFTGTSAGGLLAFETGDASGQGNVLLQTVSPSGTLMGAPLALVADDAAFGQSPAVIPFGGGFAVAFRRTTQAGTTVRLAFVDARGEVQSEQDVAVVTAPTGRVQLAQTSDGALLVSFTDGFGAGLALRGALVRCG